MSKKSSGATSSLSNPLIITIAVAWAVIALLFFLLFGVPPSNGEHPSWFFIGAYVFEMGALLGAALLCFRNWKSTQIVSGRGVWLALGLGMALYLVGDIFFFIWEVLWFQEPIISPADFFFVLSYVAMAWGMFLAVLPRRLNMELHQWLIVVCIAVLGIGIAYYFIAAATAVEPEVETDLVAPVPVEQTTAADPTAAQEGVGEPATPEVATNEANAEVSSEAVPNVEETPDSASSTNAESPAPDWVPQLEAQLEPLFFPVQIYYLVADVLLLTLATTLLLAFWGGRFSHSWRMIAAAALSFYIADTSATFRITQAQITESDLIPGNPLEAGWIFSAILFAIGATLEYGMSTRSRRGAGRRRT